MTDRKKPTNEEIEAAMADPAHHNPNRPFCIGCLRFGDTMKEYIEGARDWDEDAPLPSAADVNRYIVREEGTRNRENGHFLCTPCYAEAGMPSSPRGWVAP